MNYDECKKQINNNILKENKEQLYINKENKEERKVNLRFYIGRAQFNLHPLPSSFKPSWGFHYEQDFQH